MTHYECDVTSVNVATAHCLVQATPSLVYKCTWLIYLLNVSKVISNRPESKIATMSQLVAVMYQLVDLSLVASFQKPLDVLGPPASHCALFSTTYRSGRHGQSCKWIHVHGIFSFR